MIQVYQPNPVTELPDYLKDFPPAPRLWCDRCGEERPFAWTGDDETNEYYSCPVCGQTKSFTVR